MWSKERANEWYNARPWIRGCNFMGSDCANRIDQWQEEGFEERLSVADTELELVAKTGFNSIRIIPEFYVWKHQHDGFMDRFEQYIATAAKHGISCMIVFGNDCMPPKEEALRRLRLGKQHVDWGYHGGRKVSQHGAQPGPGYHLLDEPDLAKEHYEWVREIVTRYKDDERVIMWDVFNEPGNSNRKNLSMPHLKEFFRIIREIDPIQPLTAGIWNTSKGLEEVTEIEWFALENSDIISFHNYGSYIDNVKLIKELKKFGRPIVNTEWLARCLDNNVDEIFPLFYLEDVGCYNWGFVAGKYQTYEPWNSVWEQYEENPDMKWDFTKWFHDLYRPNLRPYDPKEIELIKAFCDLADKNFTANS